MEIPNTANILVELFQFRSFRALPTGSPAALVLLGHLISSLRLKKWLTNLWGFLHFPELVTIETCVLETLRGPYVNLRKLLSGKLRATSRTVAPARFFKFFSVVVLDSLLVNQALLLARSQATYLFSKLVPTLFKEP